MNFTDTFIKRPVFATVISLLIFIFGLRAIMDLPLRQFPEVKNTVITITTSYPGANAELIQGFITTPLQKSIASAEGIDYITSSSQQNSSVITANILLNYDPDKAFTSIMSKVSEVTNQLPKESNSPVIMKATGSQIALMYLAFGSDQMTPTQITDYISRVVQPKIETIFGVAQAQILGAKTYAMRIWLRPEKMAALNITPNDIATALRNKNVQTAAGNVKSRYISMDVLAKTDLHSPEEFENIVVYQKENVLVRLSDVATIELGAQDYDSSINFNGQQGVFIGVSVTPDANPLTVVKKVKKILPTLEQNYPSSLKSKVVYDATQYIQESIDEVSRTLIESTIIVILVIFLFLGSVRSVLIPVVTIPLSLVGVCVFMLMLGYSLNLLTLLAMVLAIGLVVDDAIVVVENVHRHIEEGHSPFESAVMGAREIALPVIAMTITLAAVYAPIGFVGGLTGALFKEFVFTLASAVLISGVIALTLSPMMCSKLLTAHDQESRLSTTIDRLFNKIRGFYQKILEITLQHRACVVTVMLTLLFSCYGLYKITPSELAPSEDQSALFISATAPKYANIDYVTHFSDQFNKIFDALPEKKDYFVINGMGAVNNIIAGLLLKPWSDRKRSQFELQSIVQQQLSQVAGLQTTVFPLPSLPISDGLPVQFTLTSTLDYKILFELANTLQANAMQSGLFMFLIHDLKFNKPEIELTIDRNKTADLGISMADLATSLATALGGNYVNWFSLQGRSYKVIPQLLREFRARPEQLQELYIRTPKGEMIPLSTLIQSKQIVQPNQLGQFQQLNSVTLSGLLIPGNTLGEGLRYLREKSNELLPQEVAYDYKGESRRFIQEGDTLLYAFLFALIIIFLVLAAQFESFRDPLIVMFSVPMSIFGALAFLNPTGTSINIYTQVGLITLIGLISKHGILMVEFANQLQIKERLSKQEAIIKSAAIRLRPILMTTAAIVLGVAPLLFASGAGAISRFDIGLVIASGMSIGTLFTLFVVPTMYTFLAKTHREI